MAYEYSELRDVLFTECGANTLQKIQDNVDSLLDGRRCFIMVEAFDGVCGDSWTLLACIDRLVEIGKIHEIPTDDELTQHRVFTR